LGTTAEVEPGKLTQAQRIGHAPSNLPFAGNPLEVAQHQKPKIDPWCQSRPAHHIGIMGLTKLLAEGVELMGFEHLLQTRIKRVGRCFGDLVGGDEKFFLNTSASSKGNSRLIPPALAYYFRCGSTTSMTKQGKQYLKTDFSTLSTGC